MPDTTKVPDNDYSCYLLLFVLRSFLLLTNHFIDHSTDLNANWLQSAFFLLGMDLARAKPSALLMVMLPVDRS